MGAPEERFTVAFDRFDVGMRTGASAPGYDLDGYCTVDPPTSSCVATKLTTDFEAYVVDKPEGVDNTTFQLLRLLGDVYAAFSPAKIDENLRRGRFGFLVDVQRYNGTANDPDVGLAFRPTLGLVDETKTPTFTEADDWKLDSEFANEVEFFGSAFVDVQAYVRDGVLHASFSRLVLPIQRSNIGNVLRIVVKDVVLTARLARDDAGARRRFEDGVIAGKWEVAEALRDIRNFAFDPEEQLPLCTQPKFDAQFRATVCPARDIQTGIDSDAQAPCNAISLGIGFSGQETKPAVERDPRLYRGPSICPEVTCDTPLDAGFADAAALPTDAGDAGADAPTD